MLDDVGLRCHNCVCTSGHASCMMQLRRCRIRGSEWRDRPPSSTTATSKLLTSSATVTLAFLRRVDVACKRAPGVQLHRSERLPRWTREQIARRNSHSVLSREHGHRCVSRGEATWQEVKTSMCMCAQPGLAVRGLALAHVHSARARRVLVCNEPCVHACVHACMRVCALLSHQWCSLARDLG